MTIYYDLTKPEDMSDELMREIVDTLMGAVTAKKKRELIIDDLKKKMLEAVESNEAEEKFYNFKGERL